jgi:hypothetical protein
MTRVLLWFSLFLFALVVAGAFRSVFQKSWWFLRKTDEAKQAYAVLAIAAAALFAWSYFGDKLEVRSIAIGGVTADVRTLQQEVQTLSEQMEVFFRSKKVEVFDKTNWTQKIRTVQRLKPHGFILEATLKAEPIPNSIEVFEGPLLMPEQDYQIDGKTVRFPANENVPDDEITIKYYPRPLPK